MAPKIPTSEQKMNAKFPNRVSEANECGLLAIILQTSRCRIDIFLAQKFKIEVKTNLELT